MQPETTRHDAEEITSAEQTREASAQPRARRRAFRVVAIVFALWVLLLNAFGLLEIVMMWLPTDTLTSILDEPPADIADERFHFMAIGVGSWAIVLAVFAQLRKPQRRVASLGLVVVIAVSAVVLYGLSGTLTSWLTEEVAMVVLPAMLLVWLHPGRGRLFEMPGLDRPMAALTAVATIPWLVFVIDNARSQWNEVGGAVHAEPEHWAIAAMAGMTVVAAAWLGSTGYLGWRLPAWIAVGASLILGVDAVVFPDAVSSLPLFWALAACLWAVVFAGAIVRRTRARSDGEHG